MLFSDDNPAPSLLPTDHQPALLDDAPAATPAAAYRVLARKYRPKTFSELIGQDVVVQTLSNAIATNRLAQAWMLTGVRGVGKTTTARIIARALNCIGLDGQGGPTADPCGQCRSCVAITADRHVDVLELDAASRTGVDDMREIIDGVRYNPLNARYKIYIIDEVHMLSKSAFNALLKTLEEPPPHVKFIFATTEIRKVPVTVLSRCQRFDLRRVDAAILEDYYARIVLAEAATTEPEALALIARSADGSVRDGLSLLDQAIARGNGAVTFAETRDMLGLGDRTRLMQLTQNVLTGKTTEALADYAELQALGADPLIILQDIAELTHLLTRAKLIPDLRERGGLPELDRDFVIGMPELGIAALSRAWQILLKGMDEVQRALHPAAAAEMVLIRLAYAAALPPPADLIRKLQQDQNLRAEAAPTASNAPNGNPPLARRGNLALAAQAAIPTEIMPEAAIASAPLVSLMPMPQDFPTLVALFAAQREMNLYAELYRYVRPVALKDHRLEVTLLPQASPDLITRTGRCLSEWTGQRWLITVVGGSENPTLAESEAELKNKERATLMSEPLMQKLFELFPDAQLLDYRLPERTSAPAANGPELISNDPGLEDEIHE
jgi:DNA polymerase III subunit gamma/tau